MPLAPRLLALATAVPSYVLGQEEVVERIKRLFGRSAVLDRLLPVFANSGIDRRYSSVPLEWYDEPHGWAERNRRYIAGALNLLESVAGQALDRAGRSIDELGGIVTVSTTGIATPSLDALLIERMQLPRNLARLPVFGLGCAGGVIGLARAADMAAAMPGKAVLLLVVELCTLSFRRDDLAKSNIVATALFGDGAAAVLVRCGGEGPGHRGDRRAQLAEQPRHHGVGGRRRRAQGSLLARHPAPDRDRAAARDRRISCPPMNSVWLRSTALSAIPAARRCSMRSSGSSG
jgi:alkylresorcinol/alkylpyrone synthase